MIPKCVTLENFLSFGKKTEIKFDDDEPLWVLGGPNGVGKSAVFDAITYCLFGEHRGGAKSHDPLIRHGANGFMVSFQFEFQEIDYRVTRIRSGGNPSQSIEEWKPKINEWKSVPNINGVADVKSWTERTLPVIPTTVRTARCSAPWSIVRSSKACRRSIAGTSCRRK